MIHSGYNLYDGKLTNISGDVIREWSYKYLGLIQKDSTYIAQKHYESKEWGKFSFNGKEIWTSKIPIHHDIVITPSGTIMTFTKEMHKYKRRNVEFDVIIEFSQNGKELWRWSSWEHLKDLKKNHKLLELDMPFLNLVKEKQKSHWGGNYDYYHFNSLQIIPKNNFGDRRFQEGNILVSARHGSIIFILDKNTKEIVWFISQNDVKDNIEGQHSVQMLPNGRLLVFDNGRYREWSRIIELNPVTLEIEWEYKSDNFFTTYQGHVQRLSNGNTLITESEKSHVFEIDSKKKIVWEWWNPKIEKDNRGRRKSLYRVIRYDKIFIDGFLQNR